MGTSVARGDAFTWEKLEMVDQLKDAVGGAGKNGRATSNGVNGAGKSKRGRGAGTSAQA